MPVSLSTLVCSIHKITCDKNGASILHCIKPLYEEELFHNQLLKEEDVADFGEDGSFD